MIDPFKTKAWSDTNLEYVYVYTHNLAFKPVKMCSFC